MGILHVEKKGIRALGVAESFSQKDHFSTLAGVVMRGDLVIDGISLGRTKVSGFDATESIGSLLASLSRNDVNAILISGSILSLYNIVDINKLSKITEKPVIALSFRKSTSDLKENIKKRFDLATARKKIAMLAEVGYSETVTLHTGYKIFLRRSGIAAEEARRFLDKFTLQGAIPEPVKVARLLAKSVAAFIGERSHVE